MPLRLLCYRHDWVVAALDSRVSLHEFETKKRKRRELETVTVPGGDMITSSVPTAVDTATMHVCDPRRGTLHTGGLQAKGDEAGGRYGSIRGTEFHQIGGNTYGMCDDSLSLQAHGDKKSVGDGREYFNS